MNNDVRDDTPIAPAMTLGREAQDLDVDTMPVVLDIDVVTLRLWEWARAEAMPKIQKEHWKEWDIEFIDACIAKWEELDPDPGERFRYHGKSFGGPALAAGRRYLWIDFDTLLENMPHVREILGMIDVYLYETHGMNEEWEAEMASS